MFGLRNIAAASILRLCTSYANVAKAVTSINDLPPAIAKLYTGLCTADFRIDGKRKTYGSTYGQFEDGTTAYLLNCGDAAAVTPFEIIVALPSGEVSEAKFHWRLRGKDVGEARFSNARFGRLPNTVVITTHSSASCEPQYLHRWNGAAFDLLDLDRKGCRRGE